MTIQEMFAATLENLINSTRSIEYNGGVTVFKFDGEEIFYLGN